AYAPIATILPPYVHEHASVSPTGIGVVFFVNTLALVVAPLPIAKALGGRNRFRALALAAPLFTITSVAVLGVGRALDGSGAVGALCGAVLLFLRAARRD